MAGVSGPGLRQASGELFWFVAAFALAGALMGGGTAYYAGGQEWGWHVAYGALMGGIMGGLGYGLAGVLVNAGATFISGMSAATAHGVATSTLLALVGGSDRGNRPL